MGKVFYQPTKEEQQSRQRRRRIALDISSFGNPAVVSVVTNIESINNQSFVIRLFVSERKRSIRGFAYCPVFHS